MKFFALLCSVVIAVATASSNFRVAFKKGDAVLEGRAKECPEDAFPGPEHIYKFKDQAEMKMGTTGKGSPEELAAIGCKEDADAMASYADGDGMPTQYFFCKHFKKDNEYRYKSCKLSGNMIMQIEKIGAYHENLPAKKKSPFKSMINGVKNTAKAAANGAVALGRRVGDKAAYLTHKLAKDNKDLDDLDDSPFNPHKK